MKPLFLSLLILIFSFPVYAQRWTEIDPPANLFNNTIFTTVAGKTGKIYAAGKFTDTSDHYAVTTLVNGVWTELGAGATPLQATNTIYALALDSSGNLYAGGAFTDLMGNYYVAKWNGTQWSELGSGVTGLHATGQIFSLATDKAGNIYAGGEFIDETGNYYISEWDGVSWSRVGSGTHSLHANGIIYTILPDAAGNIYTAGQFTDTAGNYYVAKWNGSDWMETGSGTGSLHANSSVNSMTADASGAIYAAGNFTDSSGHQYVAKWDGNSWTEEGTGPAALGANGTINSIIIDATGKLMAGGAFTNADGWYSISRWSGSGWSDISGTNGLWPVNRSIMSISSDSSGDLFAAGDFTDLYGNQFVAKLSAGTWTEPGLGGIPFPSHANPEQAVAVDTGGHIYVVEQDVDAAGIRMLDQWNGVTWNRLTNLIPGGYAYLAGLAPDSAGNIYACGTFAAQAGAARWNGNGWILLADTTGRLTMNSASYIATDKTGIVYVSGSFVENGLTYYMIKWDGKNWSPVETNSIYFYYFIVDSDGTIYGAYYDYDNDLYNVLKVAGNIVTPINGTGSRALNADTWVHAMALDASGNLFVGGGFQDDNSGNAYVARWDGNSWTRLGTGANAFPAAGIISGLVFDNAGNLYASGSLLDHSVTYIGKWDGQIWSPITSVQMFWYQAGIPFLGRDKHGIIYAEGLFQGSRGQTDYFYEYDPGSSGQQPVVCDSLIMIRLGASQISVTKQSDPVIITARVTAGGGTNTTFEFSKDRTFTTLLSAPSADSNLTIAPGSLVAGSNLIYGRVQATDACNSTITAIDSIAITDNIVTGITDVDFPNNLIGTFPNPINKFVTVSGLSTFKTYIILLRSSAGVPVSRTVVSGQTTIDIVSSTLKQGIYWLEVYDDTKRRVLGIVSVLKIQ